MNPHDLMIILTGLLAICSAMALAVTGRLLGPDYDGQMTVGPWSRFVVWLLSGVAALRGLSYLFPVDLTAIQMTSVMAPIEAAGFLVLTLMVLNFVMADRAPPPLIERLMRMAGVRLTDRQLIDLTMGLPVVEYAKPVPPETAQDRRFRYRVMAMGTGLAALAGGAMIWNSPILG